MIYTVGMLCKHFKGDNLLEKNIYEILKLNVDGKDVDGNLITYTGDGDLASSVNLVIYRNIFQDDKIFAREYDDISAPLSEEKKIKYKQDIKVQPLTEEEIRLIHTSSFAEEKRNLTMEKFKK